MLCGIVCCTTSKYSSLKYNTNSLIFSISALLNERYDNILNLHYHVKAEYYVFHAAGLKITYSGSRSYPEYIEIEGKLTQKIHIQVSYSLRIYRF